jgi:predicted ferric reductase
MARESARAKLERRAMLFTLAIILIIMWLLGMVSDYTMNGFVHILLVVALIMILVRIISGRRRIV